MQTRVARPSQVKQAKPQARPGTRRPRPRRRRALDPEAAAFPSATVWLNRAAPDPTPPAARLKLSFARQLVDLLARGARRLGARAGDATGRGPQRPRAGQRRRACARSRSSSRAIGGRANPWAAALAYSSDTSLADRVVALRHYYRAVGLASLVNGLLSQKADLQDRVLHDQRLSIYPGGRQDVAKGHVDVRVLAVMLYLAETYHQVTVSCLISGHHLYARPGVVSAHIYGRAVDIAALNGVSIFGHQQPGGITEQAVRRHPDAARRDAPRAGHLPARHGRALVRPRQPRRPHPRGVLGMALPQVALANDDGNVVCEHCLLAETALARLRGLLGRSGLSSGEGMLLRPASSIHTAFMRFPIDAVFLDRGDRVLKVAPELSPWRMAACKGARAVLELPAGEAQRRGLRPGVSLTQVWRSAPGSTPARPPGPASPRPS